MEEGLEWSVDRDTHAPVRKAHGGSSSAFCTSTSRSVDASTRQGWMCYRCSTPRVHAATTTPSTRCLLGCRDAIAFLWRWPCESLADMKPGFPDTRRTVGPPCEVIFLC
jgi:hypothetical protein